MTDAKNSNFQISLTLDDLKFAWEHVRRSVRTEVKDWLSLKIHGHPDYIEKYLSLLLDRLKQGNYFPSDAYHFYHPKTDRSLRRFEFLEMDDRIVYQHLCNSLIQNSYKAVFDLNHCQRIFGNIPIDPSVRSPFVFRRVFNETQDDGSIRYGQYDLFRKLVLNSYNEFKKHQGQPWLVRTDIRSFFYSIDHKKLMTSLDERGWLPDVGDRDLLGKCLNKWTPEQGKGIPVGYECSDYISNLYLYDLDFALEDFRVHRYVDDTYIFVDSFEEVKDVLYRIDEVLASLGLQRNTSKTQMYRLPELRKDELQKILGKSLSMLAEVREDDLSEAKRQDELLEILQRSFDPHTTADFFEDRITNIGHIAFVLYRLHREFENISELAYYIVDHDLKYAYQALRYLSVHHEDERFVAKLRSILVANYEPRTLKALALHYLQKIGDQVVDESVQTIFAKSDPDDWYLIRTILKEVIEPFLSVFPCTTFDSLLESMNPHVRLFAYWLDFRHDGSNEEQCRQVQKMLVDEFQLVKMLAIYVAHRYELLNCVDASLLEPHLRKLFPVEIRSDIDVICQHFRDVFDILIDPAFPIGKYFGSPSHVAQIMRNIYDANETDPTDFVKNMHILVNSMLTTVSKTIYGLSYDDDMDEALSLFDDEQLKDFISVIKDERAKEFVKYKRKEHLRSRFTNVVSRHVVNWHNREGLRMRKEVFICYARKNSKWKCRVETHLKLFENYFNIKSWSDSKIKKGKDWDREIKQALQRAKVAILLETPEFFESNYIHEDELPEIMRAAQDEGLIIMRFPISTSNVDVTPLGSIEAAWDTGVKLQRLEDDRSIDKMNEILAKACREIACEVSESFRLQYCNDAN